MSGWLIMYQNQLKMLSAKKILRLKNSILGLYGHVKNVLKGDVGNQKRTEYNTDLTPCKNEGATNDSCIRVEMPFNSLMTEFFEGGGANDLIQRILEHIKTQIENPRMPEGVFLLDKIMHLYIDLHRLAITRGSSYTELPEWLKSEKAVINPQNKDEEYFKWVVIAALHQEEIKKDHQRISKVKSYENQCN